MSVKELVKTTRTVYKQGSVSITVDADGAIEKEFGYGCDWGKLRDIRAVIEAALIDAADEVQNKVTNAG